MSPLHALGRRLTGPALAGTVALTEPLLRSGAGAGVIRAGIHYEAFLRDQLDRYTALTSLATGRDTELQRWARSERVHRKRLAPNRTVTRSDPHVFWHGPDRVGAPDRRSSRS